MDNTRMPLFPLSLLPMPGERRMLHIFEPRYQKLFNELEDMTLDEFGIAHLDKGRLTGVGSRMRLVVVERIGNNGERNVMVQCVGLFRMLSFRANSPDNESPPSEYPVGNVAHFPDWRAWRTGQESKREWMEHWVENPESGLAMVPPDDLVGFLAQTQTPPTLRAQLLTLDSPEDRDLKLAEWMKTQRLIRLQERQRQGGLFPN